MFLPGRPKRHGAEIRAGAQGTLLSGYRTHRQTNGQGRDRRDDYP